MTQTELSVVSGVALRTIVAIEREGLRPRIDTLLALSQALGLDSVSVLLKKPRQNAGPKETSTHSTSFEKPDLALGADFLTKAHEASPFRRLFAYSILANRPDLLLSHGQDAVRILQSIGKIAQ